jgi:tRNA modification GTPase
MFGYVFTEGRRLDDGLCFIMRAPHSYTGEDVVEIQIHGAPVVLSAVLATLWKSGARPAEAGEFTRRAFLNGRLRLSQAEAVEALVQAQTLDAARNAAQQLEGALEDKFRAIYDSIVQMVAHCQAAVDYPEEDLEPFSESQIRGTLDRLIPELEELHRSHEQSRVLTQGVKCAIIGKPNVGKSSLLNTLVGHDRAIVSPFPGTTRDTIEVSVRLGGVLLHLIDSAGIHASKDPIEQAGVERSLKAAEQADLVLVVLDGSDTLDDDDRKALDCVREKDPIVLINKVDLPTKLESEMLEAAFLHICYVSAKTGEGLEFLDSVVRRRFDTHMSVDGSILTSVRQAAAIHATLEALTRASSAIAENIPPDVVLSDLESSLQSFKELIGSDIDTDVLDRIFSQFCIGK